MNGAETSEQIDLAREAPFALGGMQVRPATREVQTGDDREVLEPRVMQVLVALARRGGDVVSRDALIAMCWNGRAVGEDAIQRCIARLRRLAENHGGFTLETIPRVGYRLLETAVPETSPDEPAMPAWRGVLRKARTWRVAAVPVLIAAGLAAWMLRPAEKVLVVHAPVRHLIAVLPFTPLSAGHDTQAFGDSVATAVADALSRIGQPVIPPAESFPFRGAAKARAAQALHAMYVVDGEVRRADGRVRVSVRFDDTIHGTTVFAHTFDEPADRAAALPDRVAAYIAAITWGSDITRWDTRFAPAILRAFEQHKRGDLFAAYQTTRTLAKAHPGNGDIQRVHAMSAVNLLFTSRAARKMDLIVEARQAADRSLRLAPGFGEAYSALASATPHVLWAEREAYLRKALAVSPESVGLAEYTTWLLNDAGRFRDAEPTARSAYERFPYHPLSFQRQIERLLGAGDAAAAQAAIPRARRLWPDHSVFLQHRLEAAAFLGPPSGADAVLREPETERQLGAETVGRWRIMVRALRSRRPADIAAVSRACAAPGDDWWSCMIALAMLGRLDDAYRIVDRAYPDQRAPTRAALMRKWLSNAELPSTRYLFVPEMAPLRADPRFRGVVERVGLLQYWRSVRRAPDFCAAEKAPVCELLISS